MLMNGTFKIGSIEQVDLARFHVQVTGFAHYNVKRGSHSRFLSCHEVVGNMVMTRADLEKLASQVDTLLARP